VGTFPEPEGPRAAAEITRGKLQKGGGVFRGLGVEELAKKETRFVAFDLRE